MGLYVVNGQPRPVPPVDSAELCVNLRHEPVWPGHQLGDRRAPQQRRGENRHHRLHGHPVRRHLGLLHAPLRKARVGDAGHGAVFHTHVLAMAHDQDAEAAADLGGGAASGHAFLSGEAVVAVLSRWELCVEQRVTDLMAEIHGARHKRIQRRQVNRQHIAKRVHLQTVSRVTPARPGRHGGEQGRRGPQLEPPLEHLPRRRRVLQQHTSGIVEQEQRRVSDRSRQALQQIGADDLVLQGAAVAPVDATAHEDNGQAGVLHSQTHNGCGILQRCQSDYACIADPKHRARPILGPYKHRLLLHSFGVLHRRQPFVKGRKRSQQGPSSQLPRQDDGFTRVCLRCRR
mmetsp:Transcript_53423/g.122240  ORF Transcript_53423/g.122240 Transcript_53423/m.122240 type:complete len:344 (-) Transcript_53423:280-1311(-)